MKFRFWSVCIGNLFEHFDTALFGCLAPFLAPLFFPKHDPLTALILTYAVIPLGMLVRPLGSLIFGRIGDLKGRQQALFLTLTGMGLVSACMAICPTYAQIGIVAPALLCFGRLMQNFFAAGEAMGGGIFLLEGSSEKRHDLLSSIYSSSTIAGILLASAGVALLCAINIVEWGWRLLYLFGCVTALVGMILRKKEPAMSDASLFSLSLKEMARLFWQQRRTLIAIALVSAFSYANYSVALVLTNGLIPLVSDFTRADMTTLNTALLVFDFAALPFFGWLSSKISREKLMLATSVCVLFSAIPLFALMHHASYSTIVCARVSFVLLGVAFAAPFYAWAQKLVPPSHRYLLVAFGYALGTQLLGGPTSSIVLWTFQKTGSLAVAAWYWMTLAGLSGLVLVKVRVAAAQEPSRGQ